MESFVTGGKTWRIPLSSDPSVSMSSPTGASVSHTTLPTNIPVSTAATASTINPVASKASLLQRGKQGLKDLLGGLGTIYALYAGAFIVVMALQVIIAIIPNDYTENMSADGGLILSSMEKGQFTLKSVLLLTLLPLAIYIIMTFLERKLWLFDNDETGDRNLYICLALIGLVLIAGMWFMTSEWKMFAGGYDVVHMTQNWMQARYGFEAYHMPDLSALINGEHLYSVDPNYPINDVYLKESNGAYFLFDSAGKELPLKK